MTTSSTHVLFPFRSENLVFKDELRCIQPAPDRDDKILQLMEKNRQRSYGIDVKLHIWHLNTTRIKSEKWKGHLWVAVRWKMDDFDSTRPCSQQLMRLKCAGNIYTKLKTNICNKLQDIGFCFFGRAFRLTFVASFISTSYTLRIQIFVYFERHLRFL